MSLSPSHPVFLYKLLKLQEWNHENSLLNNPMVLEGKVVETPSLKHIQVFIKFQI